MSANTHRYSHAAANQHGVRRRSAAVLRAACVAIAGVAGGLASVGTASAQLSSTVERAEPYKVVTTDARALVRCGPGAAYYPVAESLPVGSVLTADGTTPGGWLRVHYPERSSALVDLESVTFASDTGIVTLTRPSSLSAFNVANGARGSWSKLLTESLPAGTELVVIGEAVNQQTGERVGYEVEPPEQARAFVRESFTRRATSADLEMLSEPASEPREAQADPTPSDSTAQPTSQPTSQSGAQPAIDPAPADANEPAGASPPAADPIDDSTIEPAVAQPEMQPAVATEEGAPLAVDGTVTEPAPAEPTDAAEPEADDQIRIETIEDLGAAFTAVQAQPLAEAEFDQLIAEVDRMLEAEPVGSGLRPAIESRRNVLLIRKRVQDAWRENDEIARRAASTASEINSEIRRLQVERSYSAIGRLLPSAVYDGSRLPRMYRVQSVDTTEAPRTLGYLKPDPTLGLEAMLNQTIGVVGSPRLDPRLNLLVIEPIQIDVIGAGDG